jgi:hypothetical protein
MTHVLAEQLAEWMYRNTCGFTRRDEDGIYIEGKIDAYELLLYVQSLTAGRTTEQILNDNRTSYTGRSVNAVVEGGDFIGG